MTVESDLGTLIRKLNPYTNGRAMHFDQALPAAAPGVAAPNDPADLNIGQFEMELQAHYADEWVFKGIPHKINTAVRIKYRWPKFDENDNFICYITDYLVVGFEGTNSG